MSKISTSTLFINRPQPTASLGVSSSTDWVPNTDVYAHDEGIVVKVELAGMSREHLELTVDGNRLKISGTRPDGCRKPNCKFLAMEINYGPFESAVELPEGYDLSRARAIYQNGFLRVEVPAMRRAARKRKLPESNEQE